MKILIKNGNLITMAENRPSYEEKMDVLIVDNKIKEIGKALKVQDDLTIIDATNKIIMPGLINTHAHFPMSIFRETLDGLSLQEWLHNEIWPMEEQLSAEDIYWASMLSGIEMIKTGTTTINDMYSFTEEIIKAASELGIRMQTTRTLMNLAGDGEKRLTELNNLLNEYQNKYDNITFNAGIHGLYTSDLAYIKKCIAFAKDKQLPIHLHYCENAEEVNDITKAYHQTPIEVIEENFAGTHLLLAHAVKLPDDTIARLGKMKLHVAHCPISNLRLGCGVAKINELLAAGINVTLGTDGQGSGSNLDLFEVMKFTALLQKGLNEDPTLLPAYEVLKMATINGAKALDLDKTTGSIEVGKAADIIILAPDTELMQPINNVFADIVYNAKGSNVVTSIINGRIVMENRQIKNINEQVIYENGAKIIKRIKK